MGQIMSTFPRHMVAGRSIGLTLLALTGLGWTTLATHAARRAMVTAEGV